MKSPFVIPLDHIFVNAVAASRRDVFQLLADKASSVTGISQDECFEALMAREKLGSTALGKGLAFPHAQMEGLQSPLVFLATLADPIDFGADDKRAVDVVLGALVPKGSAGKQINLIPRYVRLLRDDGRLERIRHAQTPRDAQTVLGA